MELIEGVNIGSLPDIFDTIDNESKILKIKGDDSISSLNDDYKKFAMEIINRDNEFRSIQKGEIINGKIVALNKKEIILDIEYKDYLYIDNKASDIDIIKDFNIDDNIDVVITEINDNPFVLKGSITDLIKLNVIEKLNGYYKHNIYFTAIVKEIKPAGFLLDINIDNIIINAFMPTTLAGINKLTDDQKNQLVNQEIEVMLETLQQDKGIYVVSRRRYLQSLINDEIKRIKVDYDKNKDKIYNGCVTGCQEFGIFVEFNKCLTGMIHRYNVNEQWTSNEQWKKIVPGMDISFYIKEIIFKKKKIILTQILRESLWDTIKKDKIIDGKVLVIKPFGALIQLDQETNGLIQNSYIQKNNIKLKVGENIKVKVLSIMRDDRKIYLSLTK